MYYNLICILYALLCGQKFNSCEKWVLQQGPLASSPRWPMVVCPGQRTPTGAWRCHGGSATTRHFASMLSADRCHLSSTCTMLTVALSSPLSSHSSFEHSLPCARSPLLTPAPAAHLPQAPPLHQEAPPELRPPSRPIIHLQRLMVCATTASFPSAASSTGTSPWTAASGSSLTQLPPP
jgi:hypothetical protein